MQDEKETLYHFTSTNKAFNSFTFHGTAFPLLFPALEGDAPSRRLPPRYSVSRLRNWEPTIKDMLILTAANSSDVALLTNTNDKIAPDQESFNEYQSARLIDSRMAQVPRLSLGDDGESVLIGEALDLSSKDKVLKPAPRLEEIYESSTPLPAYFLLTHEGILAAWWIVWDKSIEAGTSYPGLMYLSQESESTTPAKPTQTTGTVETTTTTTAAPNSPPNPTFGQPGPTFGTPSTPKFGTTGFPSATPAFGKPSQPAFGSASQMGAATTPAFGATGLGQKQSPWGSASQTSVSQNSTNPFSSAAGPQSGFAKFGNNTSSGGSTFSSFSSANGGQSAFASLGQQKSALFGASNGFKGLSTEPSFGSTASLGSKDTGSTLPSWANTPAQQGGSIFGQATSSFGSTKESDMSDADDAQNRDRDEATPTPQIPPLQSKGLFGLPTSGFKLGSTFKGDESAKNEAENPVAGTGDSLFGNDFSSALGGTNSKPPSTPSKPEQSIRSPDASTTPATQPRPANSTFPLMTQTKESTIPKGVSSTEQFVPEEAPLPPDPMTYKSPKTTDDIPPLAGSPPIKVEAPSSSIPSSPSDDVDDEEEGDDEGGDISVEEEQEGDEEADEPSPSDAVRRSRTSGSGWTMQNSVNQSPRIFPAAPTPPHIGRNASPALPPTFGQQFKPNPSPFGQPSKIGNLPFSHSASTIQSSDSGGFPKPPVSLGPSNRNQESLRSPSPVRAASASTIGGTRREPLTTPGTSLSASIQQQPKPPTPQAQVSDLVDDEDDRIRRELASPIEPNRILDGFLARKEYTGAAHGKTGHAAQVEIVYRDINNMVDTVGLNWRSLKAFLDYHQKPQQYIGRSRTALEEVMEHGIDGSWFEEWRLFEMEDLMSLENELEHELDEGRVQNVLGKLSQLARLLRDKARLTTNINDIRRQLVNRKDPAKIESLRTASLPKELVDQQKLLRNEYAQLLTLLGQAEESVILLRSRLASHNAENGKTGAVPTVDAVKKTINKLIIATERKNNDITLLESQLRKAGLADSSRPNSSSSRQTGTPIRQSRSFRGESPFATPTTSRNRMSLSELSRRAQTPDVNSTPTNGYGFYYTPEGSPTSGKDLAKLNDLVDKNLPMLRETAKQRRKIAEGLASALMEKGIKTTRVN